MNKKIQQTLDHSLNNSYSKTTHAFGRSERFPKLKQSPCSQYAYDLSSSTISLNNKKINGKFGRQQRFIQSNRQIRMRSLSPSAGDYDIRGTFTKSNANPKNTSFGTQQKLKLKKNYVPGPGAYQGNSYNPQTQLSYTMRNKVKTHSHWNKVGPGQYNPNLSFSSVAHQKNTKIGKQKRFRMKKNYFPAPGLYQIAQQRFMTEQTTKYKQSTRYSFTKDPKLKNIKSDTPGPGNYKHFSQFYRAPLTYRK